MEQPGARQQSKQHRVPGTQHQRLPTLRMISPVRGVNEEEPGVSSVLLGRWVCRG